jgi:hypothetical protein
MIFGNQSRTVAKLISEMVGDNLPVVAAKRQLCSTIATESKATCSCSFVSFVPFCSNCIVPAKFPR